MSRRITSPLIVLLSSIFIVAGGMLQPAQYLSSFAQPGCQAFKETGMTVCSRFLEYWNTHGGLTQQGFPISDELNELSPTDGKTYTVQYFERAAFEAHPEFAPPNDVLLSLLGSFLYGQKYPSGAPNQDNAEIPGSRYFPETGKRIGGGFLAYWNTHGGLAQQGFPISNEFTERSETDGKSYTVQYFERAVFEYHPENQPPYDVLLSLLGSFRYNQVHGSGGGTGGGTTVCASTPSGMMLWLTGDGNANDRSGNNHNGTLKGNATYAPAKVGQGFKIAANTDYVELSDSPDWAFGSRPFTIDLWATFDSTDGYRTLLAQDEGPYVHSKWFFGWSDNVLWMFVDSTDKGAFIVGNSSNSTGKNYFAPKPGEWHHLAVTRSGTTFTFYVDGVARGTDTSDRLIPDVNAPLTIGWSENSSWTVGMRGVEDEVHILNSALSAAEIQGIYNAGAAGVCDSGGSGGSGGTGGTAGCAGVPSGMMLWLTGDGNANDKSGNNHNGALKGNATYAAGKAGPGFKFAANTDYVEVPDSSDWAFGSKPFTIDLWASFDTADSYRTLVASDEGPGIANKWFLGWSDGALWMFVHSPDKGEISIGRTDNYFTPKAGEWHHLAVTRSGTTFTFYVDGAARKTATSDREFPDVKAPLTIGFSENSPWTWGMRGIEDEVHIFNRALSSSEVQGIYNAGSAGVCGTGGGGTGGVTGTGSSAQLLKNPSCEEVVASNKPTSWSDVEGNQWMCSTGGKDGSRLLTRAPACPTQVKWQWACCNRTSTSLLTRAA